MFIVSSRAGITGSSISLKVLLCCTTINLLIVLVSSEWTDRSAALTLLIQLLLLLLSLILLLHLHLRCVLVLSILELFAKVVLFRVVVIKRSSTVCFVGNQVAIHVYLVLSKVFIQRNIVLLLVCFHTPFKSVVEVGSFRSDSNMMII